MAFTEEPIEVGTRFGQLVVLGPAEKKGPHARSRVQCLPLDFDCGEITTARNALLRDYTSWRCRKCSARASVQARKERRSHRNADSPLDSVTHSHENANVLVGEINGPIEDSSMRAKTGNAESGTSLMKLVIESARRSGQYFGEVIDVAPEMAKDLLENHNTTNRHLVETRASFYAYQMKNGQWKRNSAAIGIDVDGLLTNGQHRLRGVEISGVTVPMLFAFNCDIDARASEDCGMNRREADRLTLSGTEASATQVAVAKVFSHFPRSHAGAFSIEDIRSVIQNYGRQIDFAMQHSREHAVVTGCIARASMHLEKPVLERFCEILRTGIAVKDSEQAASRFYSWFNSKSGHSLRGSGSVNRHKLYRCTQGAIAAFSQGRRLGQIRETEEDLFPLLSPEFARVFVPAKSPVAMSEA